MPLDGFETLEGYAVFRPTGRLRLQQIVDLITEAFVTARERRIPRLLIVTTGTDPIAPPTVAERYLIIEEWARAAQGVVRTAFVLRPEIIDPQRFGLTVAANRGLVGNVFTTEEDARVWLLSDDVADAL